MLVTNVQLSFVDHNASCNRRAVAFNIKCWLLWLNYPIDYWSTEKEIVLCPFARLVSWMRDNSRKAAIVAQIRVRSLDSIPNFITQTDADDPHGEYLTIQCEILQFNQFNEPKDQEDDPPAQVTLDQSNAWISSGLGRRVTLRTSIRTLSHKISTGLTG